MGSMDSFTERRMIKFVADFRSKQGQLPTKKDLESAHFSEEAIADALKKNKIEESHVTLTNGTVVKGFKIKATE